MVQAMDADTQMIIEGYAPSGLTARQRGQRRRRLRELSQRLQRDGDRATDGPASLQPTLCTPAELTARQFGQRARRLQERQQQQGLALETHVSERGPQQVVERRVGHVPKGLLTPPPDLPRHDLGPRDIVCPECGALHWKGEMLKSSTLRNPRFGMCCGEGDKILRRVENPPEPLYRLLTSSEPEAVQFRKHIRQYNAAFAFTSLGVEMDDRLTGSGYRPFQIHGEIYHQIGTLEPAPGSRPVYAQHYLYDGDDALRSVCFALFFLPSLSVCAFILLELYRWLRVSLQIHLERLHVNRDGRGRRPYDEDSQH
jgi:hypothetical protein